MKISEAGKAITYECGVASSVFPPFRSAHEGLAIIEEEFEELKREVFKKGTKRYSWRMQREAIHLGAMAMRFLVDIE